MPRLSRIAEYLAADVLGAGDPEITGLTEDSRLVRPGDLFAAVSGTQIDGREFIPQAAEKGAVALVMEDTAGAAERAAGRPCLLVPAGSLRPSVARAAEFIYGRPSEKLTLIGLTGTNGKTTTSYLLEAVLRAAGLAPGVLGTVNFRWGGRELPAPNTTPEGSVISALLADMVKDGCRAAVLEVSSHALALGRVEALSFSLALFTNLSRDHLDFHQDFESYFAAKRRLFTDFLAPETGRAVVNVDDPWGRRLAGELGARALGFGFGPEASVRGRDLRLSRRGLRFAVEIDGMSWDQDSPLLAEVNAYNLLGTIALARTLGLDWELIRRTLSETRGAPGRLERVGADDDYLVLVDYAHSPEALHQVLKGGRELGPRRLLIVFGCGGDRDRGKRPMMGCLAGKLADLAVLTSDNPRTEDPRDILTEVEAGLIKAGVPRLEPAGPDWSGPGYLKEGDRRTAINRAVDLMGPGDILIIAGKGHENYQIIGREKRPFDDREEALAALVRSGKGGR